MIRRSYYSPTVLGSREFLTSWHLYSSPYLLILPRSHSWGPDSPKLKYHRCPSHHPLDLSGFEFPSHSPLTVASLLSQGRVRDHMITEYWAKTAEKNKVKEQVPGAGRELKKQLHNSSWSEVLLCSWNRPIWWPRVCKVGIQSGWTWLTNLAMHRGIVLGQGIKYKGTDSGKKPKNKRNGEPIKKSSAEGKTRM